MTLEIVTMVLGPAMTNAYLAADSETKDAVVIDPAWDGALIRKRLDELGWTLTGIWLTHAHFDHLGGAAALAEGSEEVALAMHPEDEWLRADGGGARYFGLDVAPGPEPTTNLEHGQVISIGGYEFEVRHAPGHTPGHVLYYCQSEGLMFCGDVIFQRSIGRTDLPKGDYSTLMESIQTQVVSLPDETRLLSGHGPETTVGEEKVHNPFL